MLKNYRYVSKLDYFTKVSDEASSLQIAEHVERNTPQSAYKSKHSTSTALLKVHNDILTNIDGRKAVFLCILDLSAACGTMDHEILLRRLRMALSTRVSDGT